MRRVAALGLSLIPCVFACKSEDPPADAATSSTPDAPEPKLPKAPAPEPVEIEPPDSEQPKPPEAQTEQAAEPTTELLVTRDIEVVDVDIEWNEIADVRKKAPYLVTMERGIVGASEDKLYTLDDRGKFVVVADNLTRDEMGVGLQGRWPSDAWLVERDPDNSGMFRPYRLVDGTRWEPIAELAELAKGDDWLYGLLWTIIRSQRGGLLLYETGKTELKRVGAPGGDVVLPDNRRNRVLGYLELPSGELQLVTAEPLEDIHYIEMGKRDLRLPEPDNHTWRISSVGLTSTQAFVLAGSVDNRYLMQYQDNTWSLWTLPWPDYVTWQGGSIHVADDQGIWVVKRNGWQDRSHFRRDVQHRSFVHHRSPDGSWQRVWSPVEGAFDFAISDDGRKLWCVAHDDRGYRLLEASALSPAPQG